jgi:DNA-binding LytR/AlgR family response regulator
MRVIIVEDEGLAAERLADLIRQYDKEIRIIGQPDSVEEAVEWFDNNESPDLAFFDIQLADGLSFEIFEKTDINCPVIFTTAYNEYALRAFKVNSIDYLLKPIDKEDLSKAFDQFFRIQEKTSTAAPAPSTEMLQEVLQMIQRNYKTRFVIKSGHQLLSVPVEEIAYFYSEHKMVWVKTMNGKKHALDYTLEQLEALLDPKDFFRLNRKYLAAYPAVLQATAYSNSRLKIQLQQHNGEEEVVMSREKVGAFKKWLDD